jgi:hypothetical protein
VHSSLCPRPCFGWGVAFSAGAAAVVSATASMVFTPMGCRVRSTGCRHQRCRSGDPRPIRGCKKPGGIRGGSSGPCAGGRVGGGKEIFPERRVGRPFGLRVAPARPANGRLLGRGTPRPADRFCLLTGPRPLDARAASVCVPALDEPAPGRVTCPALWPAGDGLRTRHTPFVSCVVGVNGGPGEGALEGPVARSRMGCKKVLRGVGQVLHWPSAF